MVDKSFIRRTGEVLGIVSPSSNLVERDVNGMAAGVMPPARSDISYITPETALNIGSVYRAVSIITSSVSQMRLGVYRDGVEIKAPALIRNPNPMDTVGGFIEETAWSLACYGNAYWRVYRGSNDMPLSLKVLDPNEVTVTEESGKLKYYLGPEEIKASDIKHLKLMRKPGHIKGYGPIQHGQSELTGAVRLRNFADNWFSISGVPQGILTTDQVLGAGEAQQFADAWAEFIKNNGTAVMSQGMRYEMLRLKPADAQFLEVQQSQTVAIARLFGVPALHLLAEMQGTSNTYLNLEQANLVFLQTTLSRYMNEIEDAFASLLPRGQEVAFKEEGLLRMDTQTKVEVEALQVAASLRTPDELRTKDGLAPLPAGYQPPTVVTSKKKDESE